MFLQEKLDDMNRALGRSGVPPEFRRLFVRGRKFRTSLLNLKPGSDHQTVKRLLSHHYLPDQAGADLIQLGMWMANSRRIFTVSEDLQTLLNATSVEDLIWNDIKLPFSGFAVSFEKPLIAQFTSGPVAYDVALVAVNEAAQREDPNYISLGLIPASFGSLRYLSSSDRHRIEKLIRSKNFSVATKEINENLERLEAVAGAFTHPFWPRDLPVFSSHLNVSVGPGCTPADAAALTPVVSQAIRIVAGMCLYLKTLPTGSPHVSAWKRNTEAVLTERGNRITDEAEICHVTTQFVLGTFERDVFNRGMDQGPNSSIQSVAPHFRTGFWRRPVGRGNDPMAEKTVWVRPTIVNLHLLAEGELPTGANALLIKEGEEQK